MAIALEVPWERNQRNESVLVIGGRTGSAQQFKCGVCLWFMLFTDRIVFPEASSWCF